MRCILSIINDTIVFVCLCVFALGGCVSDVPHDNPLDPFSSNPLTGAKLSGRVVLKNNVSVGIAGATVLMLPGTSMVETDSLGYFVFTNSQTDVQAVVVRKVLYVSDTTAVTLVRGESRKMTIELNAVPTVLLVHIVTRKIDLWWPNPIYSAYISASADDLNGVNDIDTVWVGVDSLNFGMAYSVSEKLFQTIIYASQMPTNTLEWMIGRSCIIRVRDKANAVGESAPAYGARIIEDEATPISPAALDTVSSPPEFQWTPPSSLFPFSFTITVVRLDAGTQSVVWTQSGIGSYMRTFQYPAVLQDGLYFWTISIVDEYGNIAQSKESSFIVKT